MATWLFPVFLFATWCLWAVAAAAQKAVAEASQGIPEAERRGASILPVIPVFPLGFWGIARLIDALFSPAGVWIVGCLHGVFAVVLIVSIFRDARRLKQLDAPS